jgi:hypothetical protein
VAQTYPLLAGFISAAGLHAAGPSSLIYKYLPVHIEQGLAHGRFRDVTVEVALDLIVGTTLTTVQRFATEAQKSASPEPAVAAILRGLGVSRSEAQALARTKLPAIAVPANSLLERGHARMQNQAPACGAAAG